MYVKVLNHSYNFIPTIVSPNPIIKLRHYLKHFMRHYWVSNFVDVLHSPFVFGLQRQCVEKLPAQAFEEIEALRKQLLQDQTVIYYEDFGASNKSRSVKVAELAKKHLKPARIAQILSRLVSYTQSQHILELGTSLGITTAYLAKGAKANAQIHTIEASKEVLNITFQNKLPQVQYHLGTFDEVLPNLLPQIGSLDYLFIDGNHSYEATLRYFEMAKPFIHNNTVIVFDDIYWSKGMTQAWEEIKQDPMVKVSVDLFFVGLVFFRKEQVKEHFRLRVF